MMAKVYIGDGVYMEVDDWGTVLLTTENGMIVTNRIVLETEVLNAAARHLRSYLATLDPPQRLTVKVEPLHE